MTKCYKLKIDFRYTPEVVYSTPFLGPNPQAKAQIDAVAKAGRQVRRVRTDALTKVQGDCERSIERWNCPERNP